MASTYTRKDSNLIYLRFKDPSGKWIGRPTGYRKDNIGERRQAKLLARKMAEEQRPAGRGQAGDRWEDWVDGWLDATYGGSAATTLKVYRRYWRKTLPWLLTNGIVTPSQVLYRHIPTYRDHRIAAGAGQNTIIHEVKFLSLLMGEAVKRGFASANPCVRSGLRKVPPKEKSVWSEGELAVVAEAVKGEPLWLQSTFILGACQAARLRQCAVPLCDINLERRRITYRKTKGGKPFTQPLAAKAIPELRRIIAAREKEGASTLCEIPLLPSVEWRRFLDKLGLPHLSHHGLRTTWITRAALSGGVTEAQARRFVNHGSGAVHLLYQKLNADDIALVADAPGLPSW